MHLRRGILEIQTQFPDDPDFAIAGVLWDLYDKNNDRGDTISIDLPDLWSVLSVKRKDFYEYYKAFVDAFPEKKARIDAVFIEHGFFADKNKGNGTWDYVEPFKDANGNGRYDEGEAFVDYGSAGGLPAAMFYDEGETIGKATDYGREPRSLEAYYPDAYLKVPDTEALLYTVSVKLADPLDGEDYEYTTGQSNGLIYLMPMPGHIDATITVTPAQGFNAENIYTITNDEYSEKLYASEGQGYFDEHEFDLSGKGIEILAEWEDWGFDFDGGYDSDEVIEVDWDFDDLPKPGGEGGESPSGQSDSSDGSSGSSAWIIILVVFVVIAFAAGGFFVYRYLKKIAKEEPSHEPEEKPVAKRAKKAPAKSAEKSTAKSTKKTESKTAVKFCRQCGQELSADAEFCGKCGARQS